MISYIEKRGTKEFEYHLDLEILNDKKGRPYYSMSKKINNIISKKFKTKRYNLFLSITDEKEYSAAFTILQKK